MEELKAEVKVSSLKLKKTTGMINKFAALSSKGKCSDQEWFTAIDNWIEALEESCEALIKVKEYSSGSK